MFEKTWKCLFGSVKNTPKFEDLNPLAVNLSVEKAKKIALRILEEQKWRSLEPRKFELSKNTQTNQQLWQIT